MDEKVKAAQAVTLPDLCSRVDLLSPSATGRSDLESGPRVMYVHGHMSADSALDLFSQLSPEQTLAEEEKIKGSPIHVHKASRATVLPQGGTSLLLPAFNPADKNSALISHFQVSYLCQSHLAPLFCLYTAGLDGSSARHSPRRCYTADASAISE